MSPELSRPSEDTGIGHNSAIPPTTRQHLTSLSILVAKFRNDNMGRAYPSPDHDSVGEAWSDRAGSDCLGGRFRNFKVSGMVDLGLCTLFKTYSEETL